MYRQRQSLGLAAACAFMVVACAPVAGRLPPPPSHPHGQALWQIVDGRCVPGQIDKGDPAPCTFVSLSEGRVHGYALLKDLVGPAQYLVMPTVAITGIEDERLLRPGTPDYFIPAWQARAYVAARLGVVLAREDVGVAVNSLYGRSQDLLHLHVDCLRPDMRDALARAAPTITRRWSRGPLRFGGHGYYAIRVDGADAPAADPFLLLAKGLHVPRREMGDWTLLLAGAAFADAPGFILLAERADPVHGEDGSAERMLDHACVLAKATAPAQSPVPR